MLRPLVPHRSRTVLQNAGAGLMLAAPVTFLLIFFSPEPSTRFDLAAAGTVLLVLGQVLQRIGVDF